MLVIDGDAAVLASALRHRAVVEEARTLADGAALLASRRWDVVFIDVDLAGGAAIDMISAVVGEGQARAVYGLSSDAASPHIVAALRAGAAFVLPKPIGQSRVVELLERHAGAREALEQWRTRLGIEIVGEDPLTVELLRMVRIVADSPSTVLITGESGTGKELVAQALHRGSRRRDRPFVAINCAAIPETLVESELFGHVRGAFTGADKARDGKIAAAHTGTLFLDEVGELPLHAQAKLLRVLQERSVTALGSNHAVPIDIRVIAATNRDLEQLVAEGRFRSDLYHRLNVVMLEPAPLRERKADILPLARLFFSRVNREHDDRCTGLHASAEEALMRHDWPGNVRELSNAIERAVVMSDGGPVIAAGLRLTAPRPRLMLVPPSRATATATPSMPMPMPMASEAAARLLTQVAPANDTLNLRAALDDVERRMIEQALERAAGNRTEAAALLGLNRTTLVEKIRKFGT